MARFFFNLHDDVVTSDEEGRDLPDADTARSEAEIDAREMACAEVLTGRLVLSHRIEVADERGELVTTVSFGDVVAVEN